MANRIYQFHRNLKTIILRRKGIFTKLSIFFRVFHNVSGRLNKFIYMFVVCNFHCERRKENKEKNGQVSKTRCAVRLSIVIMCKIVLDEEDMVVPSKIHILSHNQTFGCFCYQLHIWDAVTAHSFIINDSHKIIGMNKPMLYIVKQYSSSNILYGCTTVLKSKIYGVIMPYCVVKAQSSRPWWRLSCWMPLLKPWLFIIFSGFRRPKRFYDILTQILVQFIIRLISLSLQTSIRFYLQVYNE